MILFSTKFNADMTPAEFEHFSFVNHIKSGNY